MTMYDGVHVRTCGMDEPFGIGRPHVRADGTALEVELQMSS
jgi:hypothetical protein